MYSASVDARNTAADATSCGDPWVRMDGKSHLAFFLSRRKAKLAEVEGVDAIPHLGIDDARRDGIHPVNLRKASAIFFRGLRVLIRCH